MVVVVGRWSDGVQGCGVPHFWLRARARAVFFCLRARGGGGPIFVCAWRGGGVVDNSAHLGHFFGCVPSFVSVCM